MRNITLAFLAGLIIAMSAAVNTAAAPLPKPQRVTFRLADGVKITGDLSAWDGQGFEGTFGRREWADLNADDLWRLYRQFMDRKSADQWIDLGRALLVAPQGQSRAERAFSEALKLDKSVEPAIATARSAAEEARKARDSRQRAGEPGKLRTRSPEAGPFPSEPWPDLTDQQRAAATATAKADALKVLEDAGVASFETIETDCFVIYTTAPRLDAAQWGWLLDQTCHKLAPLLGLPKVSGMPAGKVPVFVLTDRQKFLQIEVKAFNQLVSEEVRGIVHYRGEQAFVNLHSAADQGDFGDLASQKAALAYLHRYRSAVRLPAWANEGLAMNAASLVTPRSDAQKDRHKIALQFIRDGGDVNALLGAGYSDENWPASGRIVGAVGGLIVELILSERPDQFIAWVNAVKGGKAWEPALKEDFGVPRLRLAEQSAAHFKVND